MRLAYNCLFPPFFALSSPYYFLKMWRRGNWRNGFAQRFAYYDEPMRLALANRNVFWLHAVSAGEMNVCVELLRVLEALSPRTKFVVSTTTTTGMGELGKKAPPHVTRIYYPLDFPRNISRAFETIKPKAIILLEAEIWPNFLWRAMKDQIPLFLVNARLSDRSFPRYKKASFLFKNLFGGLTAAGAQSEDYAARLRTVGCLPERVQVTGNLKFDSARLDANRIVDVRALLYQLGIGADAQLLVAGSTHDGEERLLAQECVRLRRRFSDLFLIVAPRHHERTYDVERAVSKSGLKTFRRSQIATETNLPPGSIDCLIVDTMGELMSFYDVATIVFVGKSLTAKGGQNPIEPAALGRPIIFGPNMQNFTDVARLFVSQAGAIQVPDAGELGEVMADLLSNPARREQLGRTAKRIVHENRGATLRTANMILDKVR